MKWNFSPLFYSRKLKSLAERTKGFDNSPRFLVGKRCSEIFKATEADCKMTHKVLVEKYPAVVEFAKSEKSTFFWLLFLELYFVARKKYKYGTVLLWDMYTRRRVQLLRSFSWSLFHLRCQIFSQLQGEDLNPRREREKRMVLLLACKWKQLFSSFFRNFFWGIFSCRDITKCGDWCMFFPKSVWSLQWSAQSKEKFWVVTIDELL